MQPNNNVGINVRKCFFIAIVVVVLAGLVLSPLWLGTPPTAPTVKVAFIGYTNSSSSNRLARFRVSNLGNVRVYRWDLFRTQLEGSPAVVNVDPNPRTSVILNPGQSEVLSVAAPSGPGRWRGQALCSFTGLSFQWSQLMLKLTHQGTRVRSYDMNSEWIDK